MRQRWGKWMGGVKPKGSESLLSNYREADEDIKPADEEKQGRIGSSD